MRTSFLNHKALSMGGGFQIATTQFHTNNHNGIFSVRFPF
jgi:hypothetical protein